MGISVSRIGDVGKGYCSCGGDPPHGNQSGVIISASENVFTNGLPTGIITSVVKADCGHTSVIVSGSSSVFVNGLGIAYIGSHFSGSCWNGNIVSGSGDVFSG